MQSHYKYGVFYAICLLAVAAVCLTVSLLSLENAVASVAFAVAALIALGLGALLIGGMVRTVRQRDRTSSRASET